MKVDSVRSLREKLRRRREKLNSVIPKLYNMMFLQFWSFLLSHEVIVGIIDDLCRRHPEMKKETARVIPNGNLIPCDNETEQAALSCFVLRELVASGDIGETAARIVYHSIPMAERDRAALNIFQNVYLDPLCEYLDEHLDDQLALLAILRRYKHKCEWFQRNSLNELAKEGERALAEHLYEHLHDQGIEFHIEPSSASGKPDLISVQTGDERLVADAKLFTGKADKGKIVKGFRQIHDYTKDYNEPFGYLIVFKTCEEDLLFPTADQEQSTPFLVHSNKTIFLLVIDIHRYDKTASQRGRPDVVEITEADLIQTAGAEG